MEGMGHLMGKFEGMSDEELQEYVRELLSYKPLPEIPTPYRVRIVKIIATESWQVEPEVWDDSNY